MSRKRSGQLTSFSPLRLEIDPHDRQWLYVNNIVVVRLDMWVFSCTPASSLINNPFALNSLLLKKFNKSYTRPCFSNRCKINNVQCIS